MEDLIQDIETAWRWLAHGEGTKAAAISAMKRMRRSVERRKTQVDDLKAEIERWLQVDALWAKTVADGIANEERLTAEIANLRRQLAEAQAERDALIAWGRRAWMVCRWSTIFAGPERRAVLRDAPPAIAGQPAAIEQR